MKALMKTTKSIKPAEVEKKWHLCLLYTSDAADD